MVIRKDLTVTYKLEFREAISEWSVLAIDTSMFLPDSLFVAYTNLLYYTAHVHIYLHYLNKIDTYERCQTFRLNAFHPEKKLIYVKSI
jgi:hypothetical protein